MSARSVQPALAWAIVALAAAAPARAQQSARIGEAQAVLAPLVEAYGPSGAEAPVRQVVQRMLPGWAKAETDTAGNLWVRAGKGAPTVVIVAHLDEIGFRVTEVRSDGSLALASIGGFFPSLFEGRPALVHTPGGPVPGVFAPRTVIDSQAPRRHGHDAQGVRAARRHPRDRPLVR
jgi:endoglucanase